MCARLLRHVVVWLFILLATSARASCDSKDAGDVVLAFDVAPSGLISAEVLRQPSRICVRNGQRSKTIFLPEIGKIRDIQPNPEVDFSPNGDFFALSFHAGDASFVLQVFNSRTGVKVYEGLHLGHAWENGTTLFIVPSVEFGDLPSRGGVARLDLRTGKRVSLCEEIGFLGRLDAKGARIIATVNLVKADGPVIAVIDLHKCSIEAKYPQEISWSKRK